MRLVTVFLLSLALSSPAFAGVRFCSNFPHPVRFAVAYQTAQGWVSEGWVEVAPQGCVDDTKHADLTDFLWTAESDPYISNGKEVKTAWGKGHSFSVKNGNFTLKNADKKSKGARLAEFNGPFSFTLPAIVATVELGADASARTTIPGPNSVLNSDPDLKLCEKSSGDEALAACDRAIASGKFNGNLLSELYNNRGVERKAKKDLDGAISDYSEAIRANAKNALAYSNRGNVLFEKENYPAAIENFNQAIELDPKSEKAYSRRGDAYNQQENYDHAIDDYKKALTLNPNDEKKASIERVLAGAYVNRGLTQKDPDAELADYNEALKLNPDSSAALNNRATIYSSKGDYDRAIQDLDQAIKLKPDYALAFRNRGDAYRGKGDRDRAVADYKQALALNPSDVQKQKIQQALDAISSGTPPPSSSASDPPAPPGPAEPSGSEPPGDVDFRDK